MGGNNETRLPGPDNLRIHESNGDVHIHDDARGTKFFMPKKQFKKKYDPLRKQLMAQVPPYEAFIQDHNGVRLVGELDVNKIVWGLATGKSPAGAPKGTPALTGLDELDDFAASL